VLPTARPHLVRCEPGELSDSDLASLVYRHGRCVGSGVDPDQWFPVASDVVTAREEAADAIDVCVSCPVRAQCLEYSLRHGSDFGVYGVWGGMVEGERRLLRGRWLGGTRVTEFLDQAETRAVTRAAATTWSADVPSALSGEHGDMPDARGRRV